MQTQVRRSQRSCPVTQVDASSDEEVLVSSNRGRRVVPRTDSELPATVPASPGVLFAGLLPEHEFPTSGQTVGERETTVPATPLVIAAVGMAVDHVPEIVLDALEEDLEPTAANVFCGSESGDDDAPLVRHGESSDNMFHPEISVEQFAKTQSG